ncbi:hypothetical protein F4782DRAFT_44360 [Xylaria castorea]|nr:hypothetical protein F4782DRAFT_44360 [Xylaria castorea]
MAPPSSYRPATSRHESSPDQLPEPLARLTINPRPKRHSDRVSKSTSSNRAKRAAAYNAERSRILGIDYSELNCLSPHELNCAQAIFNKLPMIPSIARRAPRLFHRENNQYELEYPKYSLCKLTDYWISPGLTPEAVYALWCILLKDIHQLYDARIAYAPDIETLLVAKRNDPDPATLVPLINTFDFSRHIDDQTFPWEDLKKKTVDFAKTQFHVLERLARLGDSRQSRPSRLNLRPDSVVEVLQAIGTVPELQQNLLIRQVDRYSPKLGDYVTNSIECCLNGLGLRTGPADESIQNEVRDNLFTVSHTLRLLDQNLQGGQIEHGNLKKRADLRMIYATLLIHLHAKNITVTCGLGLLKHSELVADSYTSYEGFQSVANACSQVKDAIRCLEEKGDYSCSNHQL